MQEKILIKSETSKYSSNLIIFICICIVLLSIVTMYPSCSEDMAYYRSVSQVSLKLKNAYRNAFSYALDKNPLLKVCIIVDILLLAVCILEVLWIKRSHMIVSNKRVYGVSAFGKRVDLPLDSVSAISIGLHNTISVSTASGKVSFSAIKNRDDVYNILGKLLIERQG